ncbi:hypothetical protein WJX73_010082 [Symbiochloris irregularis]|uniref:Uncharacterized protein n=1 Tax=Symbiochloris irregularis TaxID=706552 RepID=A0AAW1P4Y4_9CHLO
MPSTSRSEGSATARGGESLQVQPSGWDATEQSEETEQPPVRGHLSGEVLMDHLWHLWEKPYADLALSDLEWLEESKPVIGFLDRAKSSPRL